MLIPVKGLKGKNIISSKTVTREEIDSLMNLSLEIKKYLESGKVFDALKGKVMTPLFFEDSSRTFCSFSSAMLRLGGSIVNFKVESSSVNKGESLQDTIRTVDAYSDVVVIRHPQVDAVEISASVAKNPIINAGNGSGEHPTQALLDVLTIFAELGSVDGITIALIGDLKMGRTVHSLLKLLIHNFAVKKVFLIAPELLQMPQDVIDEIQNAVKQRGVVINKSSELTQEIVSESDVLYTTRLQKERFLKSESDAEAVSSFDRALQKIKIDSERMKCAKEKMIVMHPLPRNQELSTDFDDDPRAAYFRQMKYGLYMRMAILFSILS